MRRTPKPDGQALHLLRPALPTLGQLGPDLLHLSAGRRRAELAWPLVLPAAYLVLAWCGVWFAAVFCVVLFFPRFGVAFHDLLHQSLGLSRRRNDLWLTVVGLLALQSGHAVQAAHLAHHRRFPTADDPEAYIGQMSWWRALVEGPAYQYRMWGWALEHHPELRRIIGTEAAAHVALTLGSVAALPWTVVPALYVALVLIGDAIFPVLSENFLHKKSGGAPQHRTRTVRGWLFEKYFLELGYHLEHHAYPSVPTRNTAELARRLTPSLSALGVEPLRLTGRPIPLPAKAGRPLGGK